MKPRAFGACTGGKTLPCTWIEITGNLLRCAGDRSAAAPIETLGSHQELSNRRRLGYSRWPIIRSCRFLDVQIKAQ